MTDEPTGGDAEFKRWFAQQDPFRNSETERQIRLEQQIKQARVEQQQLTNSWLLSFGLALPYVVMMVGILALACFIGWALRALP